MAKCKDLLKKIFFTPIKTDYVIMFFRSFALILIVVTIYFIYTFGENNLSLIAALGALIAALLASYSVILNIDTTINLKKHEISNQIRNVFFQLCLIKMRLINLDNEKAKEKITYLDLDRIFDTFEDIHSLLAVIQSKDIVSIAHNDMLTDVHFIYLELTTMQTHIKALRKNIFRPEPQKSNDAIFLNPLNTIDFKLNSTIDKLTKVLTYLRSGYSEYFKLDGAIEACADYQYKKSIYELNEGNKK